MGSLCCKTNIKSSPLFHRGFKKVQWFKRATDAYGKTSMTPLNDAISSILTNAHLNFKSGASLVRDIPIGGGLIVDVESFAAYHVDKKSEREEVLMGAETDRRVRPPDNFRQNDTELFQFGEPEPAANEENDLLHSWGKI